MSFINDDFMLCNETAKKLFHSYSKDLPIIDYHCHLSPQAIYENKNFRNAFDLFLSGDHYKWRQMRTNGTDEEMITGGGDEFEKFCEFAKAMPYLIGNPLFHWTHLELKRYFGIDEILSPDTAKSIWDRCNELLAQDDFKPRALIKRSNVEVICTTDDPCDDLKYHKLIKELDFDTKVYPTFRPDKAVEILNDGFVEYINKTGAKDYHALLDFLTDRIDYFHQVGCRLSDHGLNYVPYEEGNAEEIFNKKMNGQEISLKEADIYKTAVIKHCGEQYAKYGWTMQLHIGAVRNNNTNMFNKLGPDTGFDSINDLCIAERLSKFLNSLEINDKLPKTILYTLNPKDNYVLGTMLGNFQKAPTPGKIQFGSGWWFNDQRDGMVSQMKALANLGMLGRFVGMLTDSRSFVSYPRHEYFRRIMCNLIGTWVENGEYPNDEKLLKTIVEGISYKNAKEYFGF